MKPQLNCVIKGYTTVRRDRESGKAGGVTTFIQKGMRIRLDMEVKSMILL